MIFCPLTFCFRFSALYKQRKRMDGFLQSSDITMWTEDGDDYEKMAVCMVNQSYTGLYCLYLWWRTTHLLYKICSLLLIFYDEDFLRISGSMTNEEVCVYLEFYTLPFGLIFSSFSYFFCGNHTTTYKLLLMFSVAQST